MLNATVFKPATVPVCEIAQRSEPTPESFVLVTVKTVISSRSSSGSISDRFCFPAILFRRRFNMLAYRLVKGLVLPVGIVFYVTKLYVSWHILLRVDEVN